MDDPIFDALIRELESTRDCYRAAKDKLITGLNDVVLSLCTAGTPLPDEYHLLREALAEESRLREDYLVAMTRLNDYLLRGVIPHNVKERIEPGRETRPRNAGTG